MFKRMTKILWGQNPETDIDGYDSPDPDDLSIDNAYKTRWIWFFRKFTFSSNFKY